MIAFGGPCTPRIALNAWGSHRVLRQALRYHTKARKAGSRQGVDERHWARVPSDVGYFCTGQPTLLAFCGFTWGIVNPSPKLMPGAGLESHPRARPSTYVLTVYGVQHLHDASVATYVASFLEISGSRKRN